MSVWWCLLFWVMGQCVAAGDTPKGYILRARVVTLAPEQPARILWRWGGEGLGGKVVAGELTRAAAIGTEQEEVPAPDSKGDRTLVRRGDAVYHYLQPGVWSEPFSLSDSTKWKSRFVTLTLNGLHTGTAIREAQVECEVSFGGKAIKRFTVAGPNGPTFGIYAPWHLLGENGALTDVFVSGLGSLRDYALSRADRLERYPWISQKVPKRYALVADCAGYGEGVNYAVRTTDPETIWAECRALRAMGINGFRAVPAFVQEAIRNRTGLGTAFARAGIGRTTGYPIPLAHRADGRGVSTKPGDGCPFHPDNRRALPQRIDAAVSNALAEASRTGVPEVWLLTVDEIGAVFDEAPEGKAHQGSCPYCREAFRAFVKKDGRTLADFGARDWEDIRSTYGYDAGAERTVAAANARDAQAIDQIDGVAVPAPVGEMVAQQGAQPLPTHGRDLLGYYSARFINEASAGLFEPLQRAFAEENEKKRAALARGDRDSSVARQPWVYSYALRGNTFLLGGHSLDFFDFYRHADNAFMYETSNRDPRVWPWDSYLCDVGRTLDRRMGKPFGILVKPHRGAAIQRALTAAARGAGLIYWYAYGPEWLKGDSFAARPDLQVEVGRAARLLAFGEEITHGSEWVMAPEVAVVRPFTTEVFGGAATGENGKWIYTALQHAHIPVDALDEGLLLSEDLSRYKVIVISGSHLRRDAARRLASWVEQGGVLYTSGWGLVRDEANRPLDVLFPVLGIGTRPLPELWVDVPRYDSGSLKPPRARPSPPPQEATVRALSDCNGTFALRIGRDPLKPTMDVEVLASFTDGTPAMIRHRYGKGAAVVASFYAGLEYATEAMEGRALSAEKRSFVVAPILAAGVQPVVDAASPAVEGILVRQPQSGRLALFLMNWDYTADGKLRTHTDLDVRIRNVIGLDKIRQVQSAALGRAVVLTQGAQVGQFRLPSLAEGDVLLFATEGE